MADTIPITAGSGTVVATDDVAGVHYQRIKLTDGTADSENHASVSSTGALKVEIGSGAVIANPGTSATGTITSPALAVTSFTVLAANALRKAATFFNDSVNTLYLALASTASLTSYTVQIPAGSFYELPGNVIYTGIVTGISSVASGNVRSTELT